MGNDGAVTDVVPVELLLEIGRVDLRQRQVATPDGPRTLTTKEAELLAYLASRPSEDIPREDLLREVWGYRGSAVSRTVDTTVQRLRKKVEEDPREPRHLITVHGAGYRFEPLTSVEPAAHDVPSDPPFASDRFVGRTHERAELAALLAEHRLVTLVGPGGVGKTRLARTVADELGGHLFCDLSDARDRDDLLRLVARRLAVPLSGPGASDPAERLGAAIAARGRVTLLLDNLEQVVEHAAELVPRWTADSPDLVVLATSREPLQVASERVMPLEPLPADSAVELFVARARAVRGGFDPQGEELAAVHAIARRLDGLPLALELAAARAGLLGPMALLHRLEDRFRLLVSRPRDLPERQQTLRGAIDWSWDLLAADEQAALRQAAVFRGGFDVQAAEEVLELPDGTWPLDALEELRSRSLLRAEPSGPGGELRLAMLESIREYAAEQLGDGEERSGAERRHREHYLRRGERLAAEVDRTAAAEPTRRLAHEVDNLEAVRTRSLPDDPIAAARAALVLHRALLMRGSAALHVRTLGEVREHAARLTPELRVDLSLRYARALRVAGRLDEGLAEAEAAQAEAGQLGGTSEGRATLALALAHADAGHGEAAEAAMRRAADQLQAAGDDAVHAHAVAQLAYRLSQAGRSIEAEDCAREALAAARAVGHLSVRANALSALALALGEQSRWEEADAALEESAEVHASTAQPRGRGVVVANRAALHVQRGRRGEAEPLYREAIELFAGLGDRRLVAMVKRNLAIVVLGEAREDEARALLREALALAQATGDRSSASRVLGDLGEIALLSGRFDDAETLYREGLSEMETLGDHRYAAITRCNLAVLATVAGDLDQADERWEAALPALAEVSGDRVQGYYLAHRAACVALRGEPGVDALLTDARRRLTTVGDAAGLNLVEVCAAFADLVRATASGATESSDRAEAERRRASLSGEHLGFDARVIMMLAGSLIQR